MALSYDLCVFILYDHPGFLSATERGSPYRDFIYLFTLQRLYRKHMVIVQSSCYLHLISVQKS